MLVSGIQQSDSVAYIFFFRFFSIIGYYKILNIVPCAIQWALVGYLFYLFIYFLKYLFIYLTTPGFSCDVQDLL